MRQYHLRTIPWLAYGGLTQQDYLYAMGLRSHYQMGLIEAGCDEAGRGCLAGPVVAAAVILPPDWDHPWLNDSKQLTDLQRKVMRDLLKREALGWAIASCNPLEIEQFNILQASITAMHRAVAQLSMTPELLLVDGNRFRPYFGIPHVCIVNGDRLYRSIAAASILAKTHRDEEMEALHQEYPVYGWVQNKGYPTVFHRQVLRHVGPSPHHRRTFRLDGQPIGEANYMEDGQIN